MPLTYSRRALTRHILPACLALGLLLSACSGMPSSTPAGPTEVDLGAGPTPVILTLVYQDNFTDQSSGWDDAFDTYTMRQYGGQRYHVEVRAPNLFTWGLSNRNISDFVLEVNAKQEDGPDNNCYGIIFRYQDPDNFYRFDITGDGLFLLSKFVGGHWLTLVDWTASPAIHRGVAENVLRISCLGQDISAYVNGQLVATAHDDAFRQGDIGLSAGSFDQPNVEISYDNLVVWAPPGVVIASRPKPSRPAEPRPQSSPAASRSTPGATMALTATAAISPSPVPSMTASPVPSPTMTPTTTPATPTGPVMTPPESPIILPPTGTAPISPIAPVFRSPINITDTSTPILITHTVDATPTAPIRPGQTITTASGAADQTPVYVSNIQSKPQNAPARLGKIAYPLFDATRGVYDIYVLDVASGQSRRVIENASQPALNVSGTHIAYRSWANDMRGLISRDLGGTEIWRFTTYSEAARPVWAPQEDLFLFHSRQESDRVSRLFRTRDANTEGLRSNGEVIEGESPDFLDATHIVYRGCLGNNCGLITCGLDGSAATQLTDNLSDIAPAAAPDGSRIAFMSQRSGNWHIFVMNRDGSGLIDLTPDSFNQGLPAWSPDGRQIAYVSNRNNLWALWIMNADGTRAYQAAQLPGSPDGKVRTAQPVESTGWTEEHISWSK
jgi:hypothetical protein